MPARKKQEERVEFITLGVKPEIVTLLERAVALRDKTDTQSKKEYKKCLRKAHRLATTFEENYWICTLEFGYVLG